MIRHTIAPLLVVALAALALVACRPNLPPVSGCTPGAPTCLRDRPAICSSSQRWEPVGDTDCRAVGGACVVADAGLAHCAPLAADAGAEVGP